MLPQNWHLAADDSRNACLRICTRAGGVGWRGIRGMLHRGTALKHSCFAPGHGCALRSGVWGAAPRAQSSHTNASTRAGGQGGLGSTARGGTKLVARGTGLGYYSGIELPHYKLLRLATGSQSSQPNLYTAPRRRYQ